jgi:AcrR family transcriptional regulator
MSSRTDATKLRLFKAALELFGTQGVEETSVDEIVERAGLSKATVYYHFDGKADLVQAVIEHYGGMLARRFDEIIVECGDDPADCVTELIRELLSFLTTQQSFSRLLTRELWSTDKQWHGSVTKLRHDLVESICTVVARGVDIGVFRQGIDPDFAGYALFGMTTFAALDRLVHEPERPYDDLLAQISAAVAYTLSPR